jgi:hypothetical protein
MTIRIFCVSLDKVLTKAMDESLTGGKEFLGEPVPTGSEDPAKEIIRIEPAISSRKQKLNIWKYINIRIT